MGQISPASHEERPAPSYWKWAGVRVAAAAFVLWGAFTCVFLLFYLGPRDTAKQFAGKGANPATVAAVTRYDHLDQPLYEQYGVFLRRTFAGNLGYSFYNRISVNRIVGDAAPVTASLVAGAMVFALVVGIPVGLLYARRKRRARKPASAAVYVGVGVPQVFVGLLLAYFLGYRWNLTPVTDYADFFDPPPLQPGGAVQWAYHLLLPWVTLGLSVAAVYIRVVEQVAWEARHADRESAREEAVVKGARRLLLDLGLIIGATVIVETIYSLPGLGRTCVQALNNYDLPVIQGVLVFLIGAQVLLYLCGSLAGGALSKEWRRGPMP